MKGMNEKMFVNSNIIELNDKEMIMLNYRKNPFNKKIYKITQKNCGADNYEKLTSGKVTLVIEDEEIYIKRITFPNIEKNALEKMISDELKYYYRLEEDICFSYSILNKSKYNMQIILFYINSHKLKYLKINNIKKLKAVYMLQFCLIQYIKKKINNIKKYILASVYNNNLYIIFCDEDILKANCIYKNFSGSNHEFNERLKAFIELNRCIEEFDKLYLLGFNEAVINKIEILYEYEDLGTIHKQDIFKCFV